MRTYTPDLLRVQPVGRRVTISDIAEMLVPTSPRGTVSRERADRISRRPSFPAPVEVTRTGRQWLEEDVLAWIAEHRTPRDADDTPS